MAYYDHRKHCKVMREDEAYSYYPGWAKCDCGCRNGVLWCRIDEKPRDCPECNGEGSFARHAESGVCAEFPGGPFVARR